MPKQYILKADLSTPAKIQRLLKTIQGNAKDDRSEALELLSAVKAKLRELTESPPEDAEGNPLPIVDTFTKFIQSATLALNQAGVANERLLKLAALLQKFDSKSKDGKKAGEDVNKSLFAQLQKIQSQDDDEL